MPDDPLAAFLTATGAADEHVGPEQIRALGARVTSHALEGFMLYPVIASGLMDDQQRPPDFFEIHDREWWIDARRPAARDYLTALIVAAAVSDALELDYTLWWLTKVVPTTLTIEAATVDKEGVRLTIRRQRSPELPPDLASEIHPQDFTDFVMALAEAADVVPLPAGGILTFVDG